MDYKEYIPVILISIFLGILIGQIIGILRLSYDVLGTAKKQEYENKIIYTYSWEIEK